jgi:hypothetical protein
MKTQRIYNYIYALVFLIGLCSAPDELCAQTFAGPELLARPTESSVTVHVVVDAAREIYFQYGTASGNYSDETGIFTSTANEPLKAVIGDLQPNTQYYYRLGHRAVGGSTWTYRDEHTFYTQRPPGSTFTFAVTSDSHVNILLGNASTWQQTLSNVSGDTPDFLLDLGDTFAMDSVDSETAARNAYLFQRSSTYLGGIGHSIPLFLAVGNHEQEEGWHISDSVGPVAIWCTNARKRYFPNPVPDDFYTGNADTYSALDGDQLHEDYYAWTWGNALFIVLDPFWYTETKPFTGNIGGGESSDTGSGDRWDWTLGLTQYNWLRQTLESSNSAYKFIFMHHMSGGTQDYIREGAYAVPYCEWGGYNEDGVTYAFNTRRPGWSMPIHDLLIENGVSAVFHGHDHQYAYEMRDGIVYQSMPSAGFSGNGFNLYSESNPLTIKVLPSSGHLRITVTPSKASVDYVETSGGGVAYSYTIDPNETPASCPGDFNSDGYVNEGDLPVLAGEVGRNDCSDTDCEADFNPKDNDVDGLDISNFIDALGTVCP